MTLQLEFQSVPDNVVFDVLNRDAALWVGNGILSTADLDLLARVATLPWSSVLIEPTAADLRDAIVAHADQDNTLVRIRGYVHVIASDPAGIPLPPRCLPIYFLNGVLGATDKTESASLGVLGSQRRRLNMLGALQASGAKRVFFIGVPAKDAVELLAELWESEFRCFVNIAIALDAPLPDMPEDIRDLKTLSFVRLEPARVLETLFARATALIPDSTLLIRVRDPDGTINEVDISEAELAERPISDRYELILSRDLRLLTPSELTREDLDAFFSHSRSSWRPYAAGLPWNREGAKERILQYLRRLEKSGSDGIETVYIVSEPGAGGTTTARALAFAAATEGYPTLVAKDHFYDPSATEIVSFINRTLFDKSERSGDEPKLPPIPWLLVFDTVHWSGNEQAINAFLAEVRRSGRSVLLVKVIEDEKPSGLPNGEELCYLSHELELSEVKRLGDHLNRFLSVFDRSKTDEQWRAFWEDHKPDLDVPIAAFWVALEFWLRGLISIGESVQSWLMRQFNGCEMPDDLRIRTLQIAALTMERRAVPELLLRPLASREPLSLMLDEVRQAIPALALVRQRTSIGRQWALAHDVIGRYLITGAYYDRVLMKRLGLDGPQSPAELRLKLIGDITSQGELGTASFIPYAVQFAVKTLKLDDAGNAEFYPYWRTVLKLLEAFPASVSRSSRTFNHHIAVSRRRVARSDQFDKSQEEMGEQLRKAIREIEYALYELPEAVGDESNLNLLNSLALAYQDLASFALAANEPPAVITQLREKASQAIFVALKENPSNSYALETAAKDLIQQAQLNLQDKVEFASEALGYVFQASSLDTAAGRQYQLDKLSQTAVSMLHGEGARQAIDQLKASANPMGFLAEAWITLTRGETELGGADQVLASDAAAAFDTLADAPRHWLVVRTQYDLLCRCAPKDFARQLELLDELDQTPGYRSSFQLRLERAILLHLVGRHPDANAAYKRLRQDTFEKRTEIIFVPDRLRWFTTPDGTNRVLCRAKVLDNFKYRPLAKVTELASAAVPFIAQDFGTDTIPVRETFTCYITFGPMGPFIKPPQGGAK